MLSAVSANPFVGAAGYQGAPTNALGISSPLLLAPRVTYCNPSPFVGAARSTTRTRV